MDAQTKELLQNLLTVEVLNLAQAMRNEKRIGGQNSTEDYIAQAVQRIADKKPTVLTMLAQKGLAM